MYLKWNQKTITDFSEQSINSLYNEGYVFTRLGKGVMDQTRSLRIDLTKFELNSENRRIKKKTEDLNIKVSAIPFIEYNWQIGKIAKDFYDTKFGKDIFSANKIKELLTDKEKSNFNTFFAYHIPDKMVGYAICYINDKMVHYSYPFYNLSETNDINNIGMGMMVRAIEWALQSGRQHIYLGSVQRPTDIYKLQFSGLEWFDGEKWNTDLAELKKILTHSTSSEL